MNEETFRFPRFALSMPGFLQTKHPPPRENNHRKYLNFKFLLFI
jgi:hypothetical protein